MDSQDNSMRGSPYVQRWMETFSEQMQVRLSTRDEMQKEGMNPYKNNYRPQHTAADLITKFNHLEKDQIVDVTSYSLAGRAMLLRDFGKASFIQLDDGTDRFQIYVRKGDVSDEDFLEYKKLDVGDIFFAEGVVFKTNKGELSLHAKAFKILTKSLRPLPEKFHGLTDHETRYRQRYLDLITNPEVRETLKKRSEIIRTIRQFFYKRDYLEVETPMMHSIAGGAAARPFKTHHNALDMELFMRIAPELHLKRLITGGYNKVFEMNRCFRNEGISLKHNPEFTSIEFYQAYATYEDLMQLTEELLNELVLKLHGKEIITYQGKEISFVRPFKRMTMREAVSSYAQISLDETYDKAKLIKILKTRIEDTKMLLGFETMSVDRLMVLCFEELCEEHLVNPTFITDFPTEVSPLSRRNDRNPDVVDRFELYANGWEIANAFSELNNPTDQLARFAEQAHLKDSGDEEACDVDYDYVRCLEYGMPPTAGEGIGIDRLSMILTDQPTIRDVIFFPLLKKETFFEE